MKSQCDYNPQTGAITRSGVSIGYWVGKRFMANCGGRVSTAGQVAIFLHTGAWPKNYVDHINGDCSDNRLCNLRVCTRSQNNMNRAAFRNNTSGEKGVTFSKVYRKWRLKVGCEKKEYTYLASHKVSAIVAARLIRRVLHGEFAFENRKAAV